MSVWESRIREHRIWSLLELLGPAIDQALGREGLERSRHRSAS